MVRAQKLASGVAGSSPAFPAFEKWSKPRLKRELRKLDSEISKITTRPRRMWDYVPIKYNRLRIEILDKRRQIVRMELKSRHKMAGN